jgi:two-component system KDP operon response regulator KdpE
VEEAATGEEAVEIFGRNRCDLVLLDINMPGMGGLETCRWLRRQRAEAGIVMVTVRDSEDDKVQALEAGADDFVTKPYRFRELLARMRAVLRRLKAVPEADAPVLRAGDLELDLHRRELRKAGAEIHLSPTEFELMTFFLQHQGVPVTHAKLLRTIWGPEYGNEVEYLRSYVRMLRKKVEDHPARPEYILTEPWVGYRFRSPVEAET